MAKDHVAKGIENARIREGSAVDKAHLPARPRKVEGAGNHPEIGHPRPADREGRDEGAAEARSDELEQRLEAGGAKIGELAVRLRSPAQIRHLVAQAVAIGEKQQLEKQQLEPTQNLDADLLRLVQRVVESVRDPERFVEEGVSAKAESPGEVARTAASISCDRSRRSSESVTSSVRTSRSPG